LEDETITIDDDEEEDSIQVTGVKRKAEVIESEDEDEEEDDHKLGGYSEFPSSLIHGTRGEADGSVSCVFL
jgi:hypothetical protein